MDKAEWRWEAHRTVGGPEPGLHSVLYWRQWFETWTDSQYEADSRYRDSSWLLYFLIDWDPERSSIGGFSGYSQLNLEIKAQFLMCVMVMSVEKLCAACTHVWWESLLDIYKPVCCYFSVVHRWHFPIQSFCVPQKKVKQVWNNIRMNR